jgi:hypothetical protein
MACCLKCFFDAYGALRESIKGRYFKEVFGLQRHRDLKSSFDFIAETLMAAQGEFFAVPGKGHDLAVTVSTAKQGGALLVDAIYVGGVNVLKDAEVPWMDSDGKRLHSRISKANLEEALSEQMVVPPHLLKVTYTPKEVRETDDFRIQMGWTVRKA